MKKQMHQNRSSLGILLFLFVLLLCIGLAVCLWKGWEPLLSLAFAALPALLYYLIAKTLYERRLSQQPPKQPAAVPVPVQTAPVPAQTAPVPAQTAAPPALEETAASAPKPLDLSGSREQWEAKLRAARQTEERIQQAQRQAEEEARQQEEARRRAEEEARRQAEEEARRQAEEEARRQAEEEARRQAEEEARRQAEEEARQTAEHSEELAAVLETLGKVNTSAYARVLRKNKTLAEAEQQRRKQQESSAAPESAPPAPAPAPERPAPAPAPERPAPAPAPAPAPERPAAPSPVKASAPRECYPEDEKARAFVQKALREHPRMIRTYGAVDVFIQNAGPMIDRLLQNDQLPAQKQEAVPEEKYHSDCCEAAKGLKEIMKSFQAVTAALQGASQLLDGRLTVPYAFPLQTADGRPLALTPLYLMPLSIPDPEETYRLIRWDEGLKAQVQDDRLLLLTPQGVLSLLPLPGGDAATAARLLNAHIQLLSTQKNSRTTTLLMSAA